MKTTWVHLGDLPPAVERDVARIVRLDMRGGPGLEWHYADVMSRLYVSPNTGLCMDVPEDGAEFAFNALFIVDFAGKEAKLTNQWVRPHLTIEWKKEFIQTLVNRLKEIGIKEFKVWSQHRPEALERFFESSGMDFKIKNKLVYSCWRL